MKEELEGSRAAVASPERRYSAAIQANQSLLQQALAHDRRRMEEIVDETSQRDLYLRKMEENMEAMSIQHERFQQRERDHFEQMA